MWKDIYTQIACFVYDKSNILNSSNENWRNEHFYFMKDKLNEKEIPKKLNIPPYIHNWSEVLKMNESSIM